MYKLYIFVEWSKKINRTLGHLGLLHTSQRTCNNRHKTIEHVTSQYLKYGFYPVLLSCRAVKVFDHIEVILNLRYQFKRLSVSYKVSTNNVLSTLYLLAKTLDYITDLSRQFKMTMFLLFRSLYEESRYLCIWYSNVVLIRQYRSHSQKLRKCTN